MTSSHAADDLLATYDLHSDAYIAQPFDLDQFIEDVRAVETFWLTTVTLPPE